MAKLPTAGTNPGLKYYQDYLNNEGLRWYVMQHANELNTLGPMQAPLYGINNSSNLGALPLMML